MYDIFQKLETKTISIIHLTKDFEKVWENNKITIKIKSNNIKYSATK